MTTGKSKGLTCVKLRRDVDLVVLGHKGPVMVLKIFGDDVDAIVQYCSKAQ